MITQELSCSNCGKYLRFRTKPEKTGRFIIVCDNCGHQHCRNCIYGIVTDERWNSTDTTANRVHGVMANSSLWEEERKK